MKSVTREVRPLWVNGLRSLVAVLVVTAVQGAALLEADVGYVGSEVCADCHEDLLTDFARTVHGKITFENWDGVKSCEACHGPGGTHVDAGGEGGILSGDSVGATSKCASCHDGDQFAHWSAGVHGGSDVSCSDCHQVHRGWMSSRKQRKLEVTKACLSCHEDMRKHLYQRSSHPMRDGLMSCVSCHDPHDSVAHGSIGSLTVNDKCYECHAEKRGPFLYEHQPVREDCLTCHSPHGSNQTMLLETSAPRLCQSCHMFGHHQTVPGQPTQIWNQNRSCVNCHYRIHGSNHPSGVVFLR